MTDEQRAELKRLAEAVPLKEGCTVDVASADREHARVAFNFIQAANPAAVLDLLSRVEALEALARRLMRDAPPVSRHSTNDEAGKWCEAIEEYERLLGS